MKGNVRRLEEVRAVDAACFGGKGATLGELAGKGFPVPPGFVIAAGASGSFFEGLGLSSEIRDLEDASRTPRDLASRCSALRRRIVESELSEPLAHAILEAHARLVGESDTGARCAVRSSATAEDAAWASFAGQHGTYYYVDESHLLEMVRRCWASLFSPEAVSYRSTHGISHSAVEMAVVVQEMVRSDVSGVAFTVNPMSGEKGEIVIESSWGMGAALVDGRVTPDRYLVAREGLHVRERRVAEKRFLVPCTLDEGRAGRLVDVPHELRCRETLSPEQVKTVAEWSLRCEEHFGAPQDVEWAIAKGRFHLLQSRPVTTRAREEFGKGVEGPWVLFKPYVDNFTDPLTPLSADLLSRLFPPGLRNIRGRPYLDLRMVRRLVPFEISDEDLANFLYMNGRAPSAPLRLSPLRLPRVALNGLLFTLALSVLFARTRDMPDDFMQGFRALCREVEADPSFDPLLALLRLFAQPRLLDPVGKVPIAVNLSSLRFAPWMALLRRMLRRWVPLAQSDALALLSSGEAGVLSAEMGRAIQSLGREAQAQPGVSQILVEHEPVEALALLRAEPAACPFLARLDQFLSVHGHRAIREFEMRSARWEEDPTQVVAMIRACVLSEGLPATREAGAIRARLDLDAEIRRACDARPLESIFGLRRRLIRLAAERARYYLKLRENSRFFHIMALGVVRKKILAIEAELRAQGRLRCKDDIFFLRFGEVRELREGRVGWQDVEDRIRERRLEHVRLLKLTPPPTIGIERRPERVSDESAGADQLKGQSASPGKYRGIAHVILDPSVDFTLRPGEVLVAPYTDPGWTPLFLNAGAAVVEVGSFLSHAGTVAREYGMPCVVDVAECTSRIQSGMTVEVDGDLGVVRILLGGSSS